MLDNFKMSGMKCVVTRISSFGKVVSELTSDVERCLIYDDGKVFVTVRRNIKTGLFEQGNLGMWQHRHTSYKFVEYIDGRHVFMELDKEIYYIFGSQKKLIASSSSIGKRTEKTEPTMELTFKINGKEQKPTSISKETWLKIGGFDK